MDTNGKSEAGTERAQTPPKDTGPVIQVHEATKVFGKVAALRDVTMSVRRNEVFGLIGPSGCGKTTLVKLLVGLLAPTAGSVRVLGREPVRFGQTHRERIGYMPQDFFLYPNLSALQNLHFVAGVYGVGWLKRRSHIRDMLERFELWDARKRLAQDMSGGMQRRLQLACALVHAPEVVFVDEPTAGLDPVLRIRIWHYLHQLRDQGVTIVLTTQYVDEAEHCDRVALLDRGKMVVAGSPQELRGHAVVGESLVVETGSLRQEDRELLRTLPHVLDLQGDGNGTVTLTVRDISAAIPEVTAALQQRGVAIKAVHPRVADFDDVFMKLVGQHD